MVSPNCKRQCQGCGANKYGVGICYEDRAGELEKEALFQKEAEAAIQAIAEGKAAMKALYGRKDKEETKNE